jgi:hypothetical protein
MHFNNEFQRIQHIAGLLKENAYRFFEASFIVYNEYPKNPNFWPWKTYKKVFAAFNNQYETQDFARTAAMKFNNWKMKGKPFPTFIAKFQTLAAKCGKTLEQKINALRSSVFNELKTAMMFIPTMPGKGNFDGWVLLFHNAYNNMKKAQHYINKDKDSQSQHKPNFPYQIPQPQKSQAPANPATGNNPMQFDTGNQR